MSRILVVDDAPFWRETAAQALRDGGYDVVTADDGLAGLATLSQSGADLILLDVEMPKLQGLAFLEQLRDCPEWKSIPVIMLTGDAGKSSIMQAVKLGAAEYLLKSQFCADRLLERVSKRLEAAPAPSTVPAHIPQLLDRRQSLDRMETVMKGRALGGTVAKLIASAVSPTSDAPDPIALIAQDPKLSARILTAAGSPATLSEAQKKIGPARFRDLALAIGIFDAMPAPASDGFNAIRSWQHSLAVASLCSQFAKPAQSALAYLVGLCHDIGKVFFHSHFGPEYRQVIELEKTTGTPRDELEAAMLGLTHAQLAHAIFFCMEIPAPIAQPIKAFYEAGPSRLSDDPVARLLHMADLHATALLLSSTPQALVRPLAKSECLTALGDENPQRPDGVFFATDISSLTAALAGLSPAQESAHLEPFFQRRNVSVALLGDPANSKFNPIATCLESLADLTLLDADPPAKSLADQQALVITRTAGSPDYRKALDLAARKRIPVLILTDQPAPPPAADSKNITHLPLPTALNRIADFVGKL